MGSATPGPGSQGQSWSWGPESGASPLKGIGEHLKRPGAEFGRGAAESVARTMLIGGTSARSCLILTPGIGCRRPKWASCSSGVPTERTHEVAVRDRSLLVPTSAIPLKATMIPRP